MKYSVSYLPPSKISSRLYSTHFCPPKSSIALPLCTGDQDSVMSACSPWVSCGLSYRHVGFRSYCSVWVWISSQLDVESSEPRAAASHLLSSPYLKQTQVFICQQAPYLSILGRKEKSCFTFSKDLFLILSKAAYCFELVYSPDLFRTALVTFRG